MTKATDTTSTAKKSTATLLAIIGIVVLAIVASFTIANSVAEAADEANAVLSRPPAVAMAGNANVKSPTPTATLINDIVPASRASGIVLE